MSLKHNKERTGVHRIPRKRKYPKPDFIAYFGTMSTMWRIEAVSAKAKKFAREELPVEGWMGKPEDFHTDWRVARELCGRLAGEGWTVCAKQEGRAGLGYWRSR